MNPQTPPPAPRRRGTGTLQVVAALIVVVLIILIVQNIRVGTTIFWFFGLYTRGPNGLPYPGLSVPTGWIVFFSVILGLGLGYLIARGPRRR